MARERLDLTFVLVLNHARLCCMSRAASMAAKALDAAKPLIWARCGVLRLVWIAQPSREHEKPL